MANSQQLPRKQNGKIPLLSGTLAMAALLLPAVPSPGTASEVGTASFYGRDHAGRRTASGTRFNPAAMTAAHRRLPFGSRVRVTNLRNGRAVVVIISDRGPFARNRVIDLSYGAAHRLDFVRHGTAPVRVDTALR